MDARSREKQSTRLSTRLPTSLPFRQRGVSLLGLILTLAVLATLILLGFKIFPAYLEYRAISTAIVSAKAEGVSVREIRNAFDRGAGAAYIVSISGKDLIIDNDSGEIEVSFSYQKKIPLVGPASLVFDYAGSTTQGGAAKAAE
jgi:hypothetical protein